MDLINLEGSSDINFSKIEKIYNYFIDTDEDITVFFGDLPYDVIPEDPENEYHVQCRNILKSLSNDQSINNNILKEHLRLVEDLNIKYFNIENTFNYLFSDIIVNPNISSTEFNKSLFQNIRDTLKVGENHNFYNLIGKTLISPDTISSFSLNEIYTKSNNNLI